jgi:flagellar hook-associated protein 1 FlgK
MADLLGIGVSGLQAFRRQLDTTAHNISNVNTDGYSRQRVDLATRTPDALGFGYMGNGVQIDGVRRVTDEFLTSQVISSTTAFHQTDSFEALARRVDDILANPDAGLTPALQTFFNAAQDVADDPSSIAARQVLLSEATGLVDRFGSLDERLSTLSLQTNQDIAASVNEVNGLANSIAEINRQITNILGGDPDNLPNDLLDERAELVRRLSELVGVTTLEQDNGSLNVFVGTGQALVIGNDARELQTRPDPFDAERLEISISNGTVFIPVTDQIQGGRLGGTLDFNDQILEPARRSLGRIAVVLAGTFNDQHRLGQDLNGNLGADFFQTLNTGLLVPTVADSANNSLAGFGAVSAQYDPTQLDQLTDSDYRLRTVAPGQYELVRLNDNALFSFSGAGLNADGLQISIAGAPAVGDSYLIRPTYGSASDLRLAISDAREVAAASPVRTEIDLNNAGTGTISPGRVVDAVAYGAIAPPETYTVEILAGGNYRVLDSSAAVVVPPTAYVAGSPITFNGIEVTLSGAPAAGDQFTVTPNVNGVGDNRNMLALTALQSQGTLDGGSASYLDAYGQAVSRVGASTRQAGITRDAQNVLLEQAVSARESVSGVNLDEEAANLLRFQQAYQAAAQVISTANDLFQTLISAVGR